MRYWGKNIHISGEWINSSADPNQNSLDRNPNAEAFEVEIQNQFRLLSRNPVANAVLDGFQTGSNSVTVRPLSKAAAKKAASISVLEKDADETTLGSPASAGKGSPVNVWMNEDSVTLGGHQYRSKDTLLHECFHALRQVRGRWKPTILVGWDNKEEMYATMVTNTYCSTDNRDFDMRADHSKNFTRMTETDRAFASRFNSELLDLRYTMSDVYYAIVRVKKGWNPIREYDALLSAFGGIG